MGIRYHPVAGPSQVVNPKAKVRRMKKLKLDYKELLKYVYILSTGLSFGSGILGTVYLMDQGIPIELAAVFGAGVIVVHISTMRSMVK